MKYRWMLVFAIVASLVAAALALLPQVVVLKAGDDSIPFTLPDLNDQPQQLPKGRVVLLNFWASWCSPCREEIPSMGKLYQHFGDQGLSVVGVSVDHRRDILESFVREHKIAFQVLQDPDRVVSYGYGVHMYPESFLIDRNGVIREHYIGAVDWMSPPVLDAVEQLIREPGAGGKGVVIDGDGAGNS